MCIHAQSNIAIYISHCFFQQVPNSLPALCLFIDDPLSSVSTAYICMGLVISLEDGNDVPFPSSYPLPIAPQY